MMDKIIYVYVVPVGIDYQVPVSIDIYGYVGPVGMEYKPPFILLGTFKLGEI